MDISLKYMFHLSIYQYGKSWLIIMLTGEYIMAHMILNFHIIFQYVPYIYIYFPIFFQWIGLRENLQENPIYNGNIYGFL